MDKILVIDDSAVQAEFLRSILRDDYDVSICHTAKEGLLAAKDGSFSLTERDYRVIEKAALYDLRRLIQSSGKETYTREELCGLLDTIADLKNMP